MAEPLRRPVHAAVQLAPWLIVCLLALAYLAVMGTLSLRRHQNLGTNALDLGYTTQAVWNTLQGRPFRFSTFQDAAFTLDIPIRQFRQPDVLLGYHVEPMLALIAPLYLLHDGPETLLWLQTAAIAMGALPLYLIARRRCAPPPTTRERNPAGVLPRRWPHISRWLPVACVGIYLLSPPLQAANLSDFHAVALTPVLLLAAFYCLETNRRRGFVLFALLAALCKEEVGLLVAMLGLWAALARRRWALGLGVALAGSAWSLLCFTVIMPHFSGLSGSAFLVRYGHFGESPAAIMSNLVLQPEMTLRWLRRLDVLIYLRDLWLSSGGLAILFPPAAGLALPVLAINVFSSWDWMRSGGAHYSVTSVPFLMIAAIYGVDWVARTVSQAAQPPADGASRTMADNRAVRWPRYELVGLALVTLGLVVALLNHYERGVLPLSRRFVLEPVSEHARRAAPFIVRINALAPDIPVSVGTNLYPHVAHRERLFLFPTVSDARYVLLDVLGPAYPIWPADQARTVQALLERGEFGVAAADHGLLLLERGRVDSGWPPGFFDAFHAGDTVPQVHLHVDFGSMLRLEGYDWVVRPVVSAQPIVEVTLYFQPLAPLVGQYSLVYAFLDADGQVLRLLPEDVAANWYPLSMWTPGRLVKVTRPAAQLGGAARLGVALLRPGGQVADVTARVAPIASSTGQTRSVWDHGTILELKAP